MENVALVIESQTCGTDQVVRFGDSTLTAILPETDAETARLIVLSLTEALAALQAAWLSSENELISFSLGAATNDQETRYNCLDSLCHAADRNRQRRIDTAKES
jgi:PleD family two-component response regulator